MERNKGFASILVLVLTIITIIGISSKYLFKDKELVAVKTKLSSVFWKTYKNDKLSFKYPFTWQLDSNNNEIVSPDKTIRIVFKNTVGDQGCDWTSFSGDTKSKNGIYIGSYISHSTNCLGFKTKSINRWVDTLGVVEVENGIRYIYQADASHQSRAEKIFDQIVSTFNFLTPKPSPPPEPVPVSTIPDSNLFIYKIKISKGNSDKYYKDLFLSDANRQKEDKGMNIDNDFFIFKATDKKYDGHNFSCYNKSAYSLDTVDCLTDKKLDVDIPYHGELPAYKVIVDISWGNRELIPYLKNVKYCETDKDCSIKDIYCAYGAFNQYQETDIVYGCGPMLDAQTGKDWNSIGKEAGCKNYGNDRYPVDISYTGAKCISNSCVGQGRTVTCK